MIITRTGSKTGNTYTRVKGYRETPSQPDYPDPPSSALSKILGNDQAIDSRSSSQPPPRTDGSVELPQPEICNAANCRSPFFWLDLAGNLLCSSCERPTSRALVKLELTLAGDPLAWHVHSRDDPSKRRPIGLAPGCDAGGGGVVVVDDVGPEPWEEHTLTTDAGEVRVTHRHSPISAPLNQTLDEWFASLAAGTDAILGLDKDYYRRNWSPEAARRRGRPGRKRGGKSR